MTKDRRANLKIMPWVRDDLAHFKRQRGLKSDSDAIAYLLAAHDAYVLQQMTVIRDEDIRRGIEIRNKQPILIF